MKFGVALDGYSELAGLFISNLVKKGINEKDIVDLGCLCMVKELRNLPEIIFSHPTTHNIGKCWNKVKEIVSTHDETYFYIFDVNGSKSEYIGIHKNVCYVTADEGYKGINELTNGIIDNVKNSDFS